MTREAFAFIRSFAPTGPTGSLVDRHHLLCASKGALRLEAEGQRWRLPPARAALLRAGRMATVTIPQPASTASVLFNIDFVPLARDLVAECGEWQEADETLPAYAATIFCRRRRRGR